MAVALSGERMHETAPTAVVARATVCVLDRSAHPHAASISTRACGRSAFGRSTGTMAV